MAWQSKDPSETVDYDIDWTAELNGDTIASSVWDVPAGLTNVGASFALGKAIIILAGGVAGERYTLTNTITTAGGRTFEGAASLAIIDTASLVQSALDTTIGGDDADSYVTEPEFQAYAANMGWTVGAGVGPALRRAAIYIDRAYSWLGRTASADQGLAWPRDGVPYVGGHPVPATTIPRAVKSAQCEMAWLILSGADPFETIENGAVKSVTEKVDVISTSTEYFSAQARPTFQAVDGLLSGYHSGKIGDIPLRITAVRT